MGLKVSTMTFLFLFFLLLILGFNFSEAQKVPGMYVFGDSLVDVGNNNHLKLSLNKADFPHNGIDFPGKIPTGRFSNGHNFADLLGAPSLQHHFHRLLLYKNKTQFTNPNCFSSFHHAAFFFFGHYATSCFGF
ncbi:hypothetical protein CsSME_00026165 [Camellia sinensis var. sinensis]